MARTFSDVLLEAQELSKLEYSDNNIPILISYIKEAIFFYKIRIPCKFANYFMKRQLLFI